MVIGQRIENGYSKIHSSASLEKNVCEPEFNIKKQKKIQNYCVQKLKPSVEPAIFTIISTSVISLCCKVELSEGGSVECDKIVI